MIVLGGLHHKKKHTREKPQKPIIGGTISVPLPAIGTAYSSEYGKIAAVQLLDKYTIAINKLDATIAVYAVQRCVTNPSKHSPRLTSYVMNTNQD
jgi:hypothetical protein